MQPWERTWLYFFINFAQKQVKRVAHNDENAEKVRKKHPTDQNKCT